MELRYDWKNFQRVFQPHRRKASHQESEVSGPILGAVSGNILIAAFSKGQDLSEWIGAPTEDLTAEFENREIVLFDVEQLDQQYFDALKQEHFLEQIESVRDKVVPSWSSRRDFRGLLNHDQPADHFLLAASQSSWWKSIFPSTYGVYVRLEAQDPVQLLLIVRAGKIEAYLEPTLSTAGMRDMRDPVQAVRYLEEKHGLRIQGIFAQESDWQEWSSRKDPWREIAQALRAQKAKIYPRSWGLGALIWTRAYIGL